MQKGIWQPCPRETSFHAVPQIQIDYKRYDEILAKINDPEIIAILTTDIKYIKIADLRLYQYLKSSYQ